MGIRSRIGIVSTSRVSPNRFSPTAALRNRYKMARQCSVAPRAATVERACPCSLHLPSPRQTTPFRQQKGCLRAKRALSSLVLLALSGCAPGFIYTNITTPYCTNLRGTELGAKEGIGSTKKVSLPTGRLDLTAEWDSRGIHDIAAAHGISEVLGCDQRRLSILGGLYSSRHIIVYGR